MRFAANISLLFTEWPFPDRFAAAADAGFAGVEMQFPYDHPAGLLARRREAAGVTVALLNAPVLLPTYPVGLASHPEAADAFRAELRQAADYADALGAACVNVLAGRGERRLLAERLTLAQGRLAPARVLLEALNPADVPDYAVPSLADAIAVVLDCPAPIGVQFDVYHIAAAGEDPVAVAATVPVDRIGHIQFADWPGRHEPGTGRVPVLAALRRLCERGYAGWIGAEYRPAGATLDGLWWLRDWQGEERC